MLNTRLQLEYGVSRHIYTYTLEFISNIYKMLQNIQGFAAFKHPVLLQKLELFIEKYSINRRKLIYHIKHWICKPVTLSRVLEDSVQLTRRCKKPPSTNSWWFNSSNVRLRITLANLAIITSSELNVNHIRVRSCKPSYV